MARTGQMMGKGQQVRGNIRQAERRTEERLKEMQTEQVAIQPAKRRTTEVTIGFRL
jgi:hypothetical protein